MDSRPDPERATVDGSGQEPLTDEELGSLVRTVAGGWTMPPRTLHEVPWHERVRGAQPPSPRRAVIGWLGGLGARLAAAATLAVVAVVALSLLAVWLRAPSAAPGPVGASGSPPAGGLAGSPTPAAPGPSASVGPSASASATPPWSNPGSPPPIVGELMPGRSLVLSGLGGHRPLDLGTGRLGPYVAGAGGSGEAMLVAPDGTIVCVCRPAGAAPAGASSRSRGLIVTRSAADGSVLRRTELPDLVARWQTGPTPPVDGPDLWSTSGDLSPDGATLFVGWSVRSGDHWEVGIHVVDLASGTRTQTMDLPDVPLPAGGAGALFLVDPPRVVSSPDGTRLAIRVWSATDLDIDPLRRWSAVFLEGRIGLVEPLVVGPGTLADASCSWAQDEGFASADSYYALCMPNDYDLSELVFRRVRVDGAPLGDTPISEVAPNGFGAGGFVVDRAAGAWYAWSPFGRMLAKVSLATGKIVQLRQLPLPAAPATGGWLDGLGRSIGRWLAPSTMAKTEMQPSLGISPDGSRLYALAVFDETPAEDERVPPAGILVVDTGTLDVLHHWPPTADYASLAVSADGEWVYALGMPGIDAKGQPSVTTGPSLAVHRATDGSVRLRIEGFGRDIYRFPSAVMP